VTRQSPYRQNPDLAFVHGPGFGGPGFDGVRVKVRERVRVGVMVRVVDRIRSWVRDRVWVMVCINCPGFDKQSF